MQRGRRWVVLSSKKERTILYEYNRAKANSHFLVGDHCLDACRNIKIQEKGAFVWYSPIETLRLLLILIQTINLTSALCYPLQLASYFLLLLQWHQMQLSQQRDRRRDSCSDETMVTPGCEGVDSRLAIDILVDHYSVKARIIQNVCKREEQSPFLFCGCLPF